MIASKLCSGAVFRRCITPATVNALSQARYLSDDVESFGPKIKSIWDVPHLNPIFENNRKWVKEMKENDPEFFDRMAKGQKPQFLLIGCSDSRVPAQEIMGLKAGELFMHRNVANLCINTDLNFLSVLDYAVNYLEVQDIIVLGHYGCGGVAASTDREDHGLLSHWLKNIRDVQRLHRKELSQIKDKKQHLNRLIELNVQEQCINLYGNTIVQKHHAHKGYPNIHGFVYDIHDGLLKKLEINFRDEIKKYKDIYSTYEFPPEVRGAKE